MLETVKKPLYKGCKLSLLLVVSRLINIKCEFNLPNRAIDNVLSLMKEICPLGNEMFATYYSTKKLLATSQLSHKSIDACPNGCMLYWKDKVDLEICEHCGADRYKKQTLRGKGVAKKVLMYFLIGSRLQRLYATKGTTEQIDGIMRIHMYVVPWLICVIVKYGNISIQLSRNFPLSLTMFDWGYVAMDSLILEISAKRTHVGQ